MCFASPPEPEDPVDTEAEAVQDAYTEERQRQASAFDTTDTDIIGGMVRKQQVPGVNVTMKSLIGA